MTDIASVSDRLHSEFVCLLFLQAHRETDLFSTVSEVQHAQPKSGQFHFKRSVLLAVKNMVRPRISQGYRSTYHDKHRW